jgi:hypothetical protein
MYVFLFFNTHTHTLYVATHNAPPVSPHTCVQVMAMIPGFNANFMGAGNDKSSALTVKRYITIIESMTEKELDSTNVKIFADERRIMRLARGSGGGGGYMCVFWGGCWMLGLGGERCVFVSSMGAAGCRMAVRGWRPGGAWLMAQMGGSVCVCGLLDSGGGGA